MKQLIENSIRISSSDGTKYRILQLLGVGGNCEVYLGIAISGKYRGILFAIKFFLKIKDLVRLEQFKKEIAFLKEKAIHPAIMKVFDDGEYYDTNSQCEIPFMIADYFDDRLDWRISNHKLQRAEKLIYLTQLLSALQYLSDLDPKIVHRDIKPQNIFLRGNTCVLGDFGLMRDLSKDGYNDDGNFFKESPGAGMPYGYRTPDLVKYAKKEESLTTASDIFQLGLVAAEMFTGRNPLKKCEDKLDDIELYELATISGSDGPMIRALIKNMLIINPQKRANHEELLDGFDGALNSCTEKSVDLNGYAF